MAVGARQIFQNFQAKYLVPRKQWSFLSLRKTNSTTEFTVTL